MGIYDMMPCMDEQHQMRITTSVPYEGVGNRTIMIV